MTDVLCHRPSSVSSTQLEVQAHVDDPVLSCHLADLLGKAGAIEQWRLVAGSRIADLSTAAGLQPPADTAVSDSNGFLLEWGVVVQISFR